MNDLRDAVDRMRYGLGQLLDYGVRYRAELRGAKPLLAFGRAPTPDAGWIAEILQQNGVGFACNTGAEVLPMNDVAHDSRLFAG